MQVNEQITTTAEINAGLQQLTDIQGTLNSMLTVMANLKLKMTLDLSPDCKELGQNAGFVKDCRDKLMDKIIINMVQFSNAIRELTNTCNPESTGNMLNRDYKKQLKELEQNNEN